MPLRSLFPVGESGSPQRIIIDYRSEGFPAGSPVGNGYATLQTNWGELLWAAVTVGRPNRQYVFRHGDASTYEAVFRWSLVRMALEQLRPSAYRLRRTEAAKTLDPSEKGAVSYFLGMTFCKLFSARLLGALWVMHLDVFRPQLDLVLKGRSRPDLVGQTLSGNWIAIESKGRISPPNNDAKNKAKQQAQRIISVDGQTPSFRIGGITYFSNDVLQFFWRDPEPEGGNSENQIKLKYDDSILRYYYLPVLDLIRSKPKYLRKMLQESVLMQIKNLDIEIGIHPTILNLLVEDKWGEAVKMCRKDAEGINRLAYQPDGIRIVAGPSWLSKFIEFGEPGE